MPFRKSLPWLGSLVVHSFIVAIPLRLGDFGALFPAGGGLDFTLEQSTQGAVGKAAPVSSLPEPKTPSIAKSVPQERVPDGEVHAQQPVPADPLSALLDTERDAAPVTVPAGSPGKGVSAEIGWESAARSILRRQAIPFPKVLSASGQEADCEARITVTALGTVTNVEIVKSSGYTEIDASVQSALRGYVFSRNYSSEEKETVGTVKFRFRLEKLD
jgi:TonB family protein